MNTQKVVMMMGGPGSGKSYASRQLFGEIYTINADEIKKEHPDYDMVNNPSNNEIHEWSSQEATRRAYAAIAAGESFLFDGTGKTAEKYVQMAKAAHEVGAEVELVYVACDLKTAIERNQKRARTVCEKMLRKAHAAIPVSFEIVSRYVDTVTVFDNS